MKKIKKRTTEGKADADAGVGISRSSTPSSPEHPPVRHGLNPIALRMLLWAYFNPNPDPDIVTSSAPSHVQAINRLNASGYITKRSHTQWITTAKGNALVEAILDLPEPVLIERWGLPK